jgi:hypothetical protein
MTTSNLSYIENNKYLTTKADAAVKEQYRIKSPKLDSYLKLIVGQNKVTLLKECNTQIKFMLHKTNRDLAETIEIEDLFHQLDKKIARLERTIRQ